MSRCFQTQSVRIQIRYSSVPIVFQKVQMLSEHLWIQYAVLKWGGGKVLLFTWLCCYILLRWAGEDVKCIDEDFGHTVFDGIAVFPYAGAQLALDV